MKPMRGLVDRKLRRARLLAARARAVRSIARIGILTGQWDGGSVVRQFLGETTRGDRR
jgi:hypothetical protein